MGNQESDENELEVSCLNDPSLLAIEQTMQERVTGPQAETPRLREYAAPRNQIEVGVAEILAGILMVERVGVHDNFILLGGESLLAAQAAWKIRDRFGVEVSLRSILVGTVADIAAEIDEASRGTQNDQ